MSQNKGEDEGGLSQMNQFQFAEYLPALQEMIDSVSPKMRGNLKPVSHDHEVFIENHPPLIVINDNNMQSPGANKFLPPLTLSVSKPALKDITESRIDTATVSRRFSKFPFSYDQSIVASEFEEEQSALTSGQESYTMTPNKRKRLSVFSSMKASLAIEESSQQVEEEQAVDIFKDDHKDERHASQPIKAALKKFVDSKWTSLIMTFFILFALFGDNIRIICFHSPADDFFSYASLVTMGVFLVEIMINFYVSKEYRFSFFFWLDLISTISIILDVNFISNSILPDS